MKNTRKILAAAFLLFVGNANANTQTMINGTEEKPFTVNVNVQYDMGGYSIPKDHGMGSKALGGNVGFSQYVGHDFEYGINLYNGVSTNLKDKLFVENGKYDGFRTGADISARYMPLISDDIRIGGLLDIGYTRFFGESYKHMYKAFSFGDMTFAIGPSFMHHAMPVFAWGFGLTYGMTEMRFGSEKASLEEKQYSNLHTVRVPFNFAFKTTDYLDVTLAVDPGWRHLGTNHAFFHGIFFDAAAGVNFRF